MKGDKMKWLYTFVLLLATIGWAVFAVTIVKSTMATPTPIGVLEASGVSVLLGALISWNADVNRYWFRKKPPQS
jgi:hypothetical protein